MNGSTTAAADRFFLSGRDFEPAYMALHRSGELQQRAEQAVHGLAHCHVCPRDCGVDRLADRTAVCKIGRYAEVASYGPHLGEEDCLRGWRGSGTIFFSFCNLRCVFCLHPETRISTDQGLTCVADLFEQGVDEVEHHRGQVRFLKGNVRIVTREGTWAPASKVFRHHFAGDLVVLKPFNCPPLWLTPNHNVFVVPKADIRRVVKIPASHLTKDHYLIVPKLPKIDPSTGRRRSRWQEMEDCFLVPLHRVEQVPYAGPVYNLEVDDADHSYLAPFAAVSNCQNYDISQGGHGVETHPRRLAQMMLELQELGCHNINFVTPEHVVPQMLEALVSAVEQGLRLPIVYNTSAYDSMHSLQLLDGVVDIYMPDFKFWDPVRSLRYLKARDYPEAARRAFTEMHRQVGDLKFDERGLAKRGLLVRHLVMPGLLDETQAILHFLAQEISPDTYVNIMAQYYPAGKVNADRYAEIDRHITRDEYQEAIRLARQFGLQRLDRRFGGI